MAIKLRTYGQVPWIWPLDGAISETIKPSDVMAYMHGFAEGATLPLKDGEEPTVFTLRGLTSEVYDRIKELPDGSIDREKLACQYGIVGVKNFIDQTGKARAFRLVENLYGQGLAEEDVDALGFFRGLRVGLLGAILRITYSE